MKYVFLLQYLNTGVLFLLVNMDISEFSDDLNVNGLHPDFTITWYKDVGRNIVAVMIFNIFWPIIEFVIQYLLLTAKRLND